MSCLTIDRHAHRDADVARSPVTTGLGAGDAKVATTLDLPSPCVAPIVLITNATGTSWFAASGD